ncbi:sulfotransferase family protein [Alteromonas gracilis]|uniref:sulfotransferase family protein n=1 Tax=Alteromonas gracilis TaxID=1479524 RepID=UPI002FE1F645
MRCVFIGGCDRSGTTFLASLLGGALDSIVTPESIFKDYLLNANGELSKELIDKLKNDWRFKVWGVSLQDRHHNLEVSELLLSLVHEFASKHKREDPAYWIDHSPNNFNNFKSLTSLFPDCVFIHIVRDGRSVCSSLMKREWGPNTPLYSSFYWKDKLIAPLAYSYKFPNRVITVKYEELVEKPKSEIVKVISKITNQNFFEINDFKPVDYFLPKFTRKQHSLIGSTADKSKLQENALLSEQGGKLFDYYCSDLLRALGYKVEKVEKPKMRLVVYYVLKEIILNRVNLIKYKRLRYNG